MELTLQTLCTVLTSACSLVRGFICFTSVSSAVEGSDRISMQWVICQAFQDSLPLKSRFHHFETWEKSIFSLSPLQHVASLAGSFKPHLQYLSKISVLHTPKRYRLSVSVCRTISLLTFSKREMTLIISFAIAPSSLFSSEQHSYGS